MLPLLTKFLYTAPIPSPEEQAKAHGSHDNQSCLDWTLSGYSGWFVQHMYKYGHMSLCGELITPFLVTIVNMCENHGLKPRLPFNSGYETMVSGIVTVR